MARITQLTVGGSSAAWSSLGFSLDDSCCAFGDVVVRIDSDHEPGFVSWTLGDVVVSEPPDGLMTTFDDRCVSVASASSILDVVGIDHVVVMTNDLERTTSAIARVTGEPLKRVREAGDGIRQGFHRLGSVIVEVVENVRVAQTHLWGFVLTVNNLDDVVAHVGPDVIGPPRDAVQPGRRIATIRSGVGLGVPVALITPGA